MTKQKVTKQEEIKALWEKLDLQLLSARVIFSDDKTCCIDFYPFGNGNPDNMIAYIELTLNEDLTGGTFCIDEE